jgi:hypothetical protein
MGHRHLTNWATYAAHFNLPMRLDGLDVLDVGVMAGGCWSYGNTGPLQFVMLSSRQELSLR